MIQKFFLRLLFNVGKIVLFSALSIKKYVFKGDHSILIQVLTFLMKPYPI